MVLTQRPLRVVVVEIFKLFSFMNLEDFLCVGAMRVFHILFYL